ncbi:MAG TPA: ferritin-like domain-containing protein [Gaiellaceae bacterium]|nr:ferritin-like domain-containing protein [Gaiellaceae bacterium]
MHLRTGFDRAELVRRACVAVAAGAGVAALARPAAAATLPDEDLAYLRLLIGSELLEVDFTSQALASGKLDTASSAVVKQMAADEKAHDNSLAQLLAGSGQTPATSEDIDFGYPKGSFATKHAILSLAHSIETVVLGAYLGAIENVQTPALRLPIGQIAATEAQHVGALAALGGKPVIGRAFAASLQIDTVSSFLDTFES